MIGPRVGGGGGGGGGGVEKRLISMSVHSKLACKHFPLLQIDVCRSELMKSAFAGLLRR